jgi:hypothetical protein
VSQEDLLIHIFCLIDDLLKDLNPPRLRSHGPPPKLADSEVIALVCFGELLGVDTDKGIFTLGRTRYAHLFPALSDLSRTSFLRQAANLWGLLAALQGRLARAFLAGRPEPPLWVLDSFPLAVCRYGRAPSCKRLAGVTAFGYDASSRAVFFGLKVHLRAASGVVAQLELAPANRHDSDLAIDLMPRGVGLSLADRNYWSPPTFEEVAQEGKLLLAPFKVKRLDKRPRWSALLSRLRQPIEPLIGQLAVRLNIKRTWARDLWHLCSRLHRKVLAHTAAVFINASLGNEPTRLELLMSE